MRLPGMRSLSKDDWLMTPMLRRVWSTSVPLRNDDAETIRVAADRATAELNRSIESRQYKTDPHSAVTIVVSQKTDVLNHSPSVLMAEREVFLTAKQDLEWRLESALRDRVAIDDQIRLGEETEHQADDAEWLDRHEKLIYQRAELDRRVVDLRKELGWS